VETGEDKTKKSYLPQKDPLKKKKMKKKKKRKKKIKMKKKKKNYLQ
jgi:hypothetical protein